MAIVQAEGLTRYYGNRCALQDVGFSIDAGEIVGILGLNGAGKSTLLRILAGLLMPSSGHVSVGGVDVLEAPAAARKRIGFLPEEPPLYREMTVKAYLAFAGRLKGMPGGTVDARIPEVASRVGLDSGDLERVIDELSHGYKKRVGIAQAILHEPELVILDEPISGLDPRQIVDMRGTIGSLRGRHTVLVSSHILSEISQTCDRLLLIHEGRLVAAGTEDHLASKLAGGRRISITVRGKRSDVDAFLEKHKEVAHHTLRQEGEDLVDIVATLESDAVEALVAALVEGGFGVRRVAEEESELEQVFLDLTRTREAA